MFQSIAGYIILGIPVVIYLGILTYSPSPLDCSHLDPQ